MHFYGQLINFSKLMKRKQKSVQVLVRYYKHTLV